MSDKDAIYRQDAIKTIKDADQILVVSEGQIVEQGDHNTLLGMNGVYSHMVKLQAS